jgi:hypothetical protein
MSESHAEIKDACDGIETKLDEIAADIREVPFDYKIVEKYANIDQEIYDIHKWYDKYKEIVAGYETYVREREGVLERIKELEKKTRFLNHEVQNNKINHSQKLGHGGSFSQLSLK